MYRLVTAVVLSRKQLQGYYVRSQNVIRALEFVLCLAECRSDVELNPEPLSSEGGT